MTDDISLAPPAPNPPCALFMGDFNVGKSALINAILRREVLAAERCESRALPTLLGGTAEAEASFAALSAAPDEAAALSHEQFLAIRQPEEGEHDCVALAASLPACPFQRLLIVDTAGLSSDSLAPVQVDSLAQPEDVLFVVVTDIDYWAARHTMDLIAHHKGIFGANLIVVANKADGLNAHEVRRICEKAPRRMESYGISPAPRFFALSARLEAARELVHDEYRNRVKPAVRDCCDAGFDALRVALYEFEAAHAPAVPLSPAELLAAPITTSFLRTQQGAAA